MRISTTISKTKAASLMMGSSGKIFSVTFTKRTTGEARIMKARLGVKKGVTGAGRKFKPSDHALLSVYEMPQNQFRMVNLNGVTNLTLQGEKFKVE